MAEEYPQNLTQLEANFGTEEVCRAYLDRLRWLHGFRCPRCGSDRSWPVRGVLLECAACGCQTSVTAGTIFQDTRTPLSVWFRAMWWVTTQKNGASALGLQRVLGLKSYETAWTWLHKLRRAMLRPGRDRLTGRIEVDECYLGGLEEGLPGRLNLDKTLVVVAAQEDGPGIGRIRMRQIIDASAESLMPFVRESVEPGSVIHTDGWLGYLPLERNGYQHEVTFLKGKKKTPSRLMPLGPPRDLPAQAVADRHPPGSSQPQTSGLLPGRVHVPIQPATIKKPWQAFLPAGTASGSCRTRSFGSDP